MTENTPALAETIDGILDRFLSARVLVIGDVMLDRFVYGETSRISPEAPVPVLKIARDSKMLGGAGNALANLIGLGVKSDLIALVGDDDSGLEVEALLSSLGVSADHLVKSDDRPTALKTRYLSGHQQLLRTDHEQTHVLEEALEEKILEKAAGVLKSKENCPDILLLSDYGKSLLSGRVLKELIKMAKAANVRVLVDPKGHDYKRYKGAFAVTPNKKELSEATGEESLDDDLDVVGAAQNLIKECGIANVVATRGKDGMSIVPKSGDVTHIRGTDQEVFDVSGAGDAVIASIAAGLAAGLSLEEAADIANIAGGVVVAKVGTAPIRATELRRAVHENAVRSADLCEAGEAQETVKRWRAKGLKIGLTNGCFDILHAGHVTYLKEARAKCDRLIVGLNHDASVRILKGPERPVHDEEARAAVLSALSPVDMVVLFGAEKEGQDNTATALVQAFQPDLYFKGGDYKPEDIPEAPIVRDHGGEVLALSHMQRQSTTNSLKKMKETR